jgi:Fur family ferric uptake transcriptional regulator
MGDFLKEQILDKLKVIVKEKGLKYTKQRELILKTILTSSNKHLSAEDIYNIIITKYPNEKIGIATIYRALIFLEDNNLITSIAIENSIKKYEANIKKHHDHLICIECGKIVEFINDNIEKEQEQIAKNSGFNLIDHTMYLYGVCSDCAKKN